MKDLVEYIAKEIVAHPDEVKVTETNRDGRLLYQLEVAEEDKGKIIGRQGHVAQAIRVLLRVAAVKHSARAVLEIV
ncbi:MAG: KH domain-containing protein [Chloroflexota bacterium]|nr:KH domain-containing protein [Chloroflexota bacterium]|tara:strand:+ start:631 stop:858 length:228 start_codon:yes stop_codon:yes gene_type:complete